MANVLSFFRPVAFSIRGTHPNGDKLLTKPRFNKKEVLNHLQHLEREGFKDLVIMRYKLVFDTHVTEETI